MFCYGLNVREEANKSAGDLDDMDFEAVWNDLKDEEDGQQEVCWCCLGKMVSDHISPKSIIRLWLD